MRKFLIVLTAMLFNANVICAEKTSYIPPAGFVPDEKTAIQIAQAIWIPIYGEDKIKKEKPYTATLLDGVWTVKGNLKKGWNGGVAVAEISKEDGRIIYVAHGK